MITGCPTLRDDLVFVEAKDKSQPGSYLVEDPVARAVFEIGDVERFICLQLDGRTPLAQVCGRVPRRFSAALSEEKLIDFVYQLGVQGLLVRRTSAAGPKETVYRRVARVPHRLAPGLARRDGGVIRRALTWPFRVLTRWLFMAPWDFLSLPAEVPGVPAPKKWKLCDPSRALAWLAPKLSWCFTKTFVGATLVPLALAIYILVMQWSDLWNGIELLWNPLGYLIVLLAGVLLVHIPHQFTHAIVCTYYGGNVRGCGVLFLAHVLPTFYCDMEDAAWIKDKHKRVWCALAGVHYQLMAFSIGLIGWWLTSPAALPHAIWLAIASSALLGILINAVPTNKRDLYFALSLGFEMPDLRERACSLMRAWVRWKRYPEPLTPSERGWFWAFGILVNLMTITSLVFVGLIFYRASEIHHQNAGLVFVGVGLIALQDHARLYFGRPWTWLKQRVSAILRYTLTGVLVVGIVYVMFLPYPYDSGGPFTFLPLKRLDIHVEMEGMVDSVQVKEGQWVEAGQPLASLVRRIPERNLKAARAQLDGTNAQLELLQKGPKPEEVVMAEKAIEKAEAKLAWSEPRAVRYAELFKQELVSLQEYETAQQVRDIDLKELEQAKASLNLVVSGARKEQIDALQAQLRSLQALVDNYEVDVERTVVYSPIPGRVVTPRPEELIGQYLKPGQKDLLMEVEDSRTIQAEVDVPEEDLPGIKIGSDARVVTWTYPETTFHGKVASIAPVATAQTTWKVVRIITEIPNTDGLLKSEMTGYAKIATGYRPVWDVFSRPVVRWFQVEVWYWIP